MLIFTGRHVVHLDERGKKCIKMVLTVLKIVISGGGGGGGGDGSGKKCIKILNGFNCT